MAICMLSFPPKYHTSSFISDFEFRTWLSSYHIFFVFRFPHDYLGCLLMFSAGQSDLISFSTVGKTIVHCNLSVRNGTMPKLNFKIFFEFIFMSTFIGTLLSYLSHLSL